MPFTEPGAATADADWIAHDPITEEQRDAGPAPRPVPNLSWRSTTAPGTPDLAPT